MQIDPLRRREFITLLGSCAAWPLAARAQQTGEVRRIGFLRAAPPPERELNAFVSALAERGYVQGRNFVMVPQWGDGNVAHLAELAVALMNAPIDVIVAEGTIVARAAATVTSTIPIVMVGVADPFAGGLVERPLRESRVVLPGKKWKSECPKDPTARRPPGIRRAGGRGILHR
jgi:putative ABC transport system substrate-binding protein